VLRLALNTYAHRELWLCKVLLDAPAIPKTGQNCMKFGLICHSGREPSGTTELSKILFKKTLTPTGGSEKLTPHTE